VLFVSFRKLELVKRYPLQISRGTSTSTENLFVFVSDGTHAGVGELSPATASEWTAEKGQAQLQEFLGAKGDDDLKSAPLLDHGHAPHVIWRAMKDANIDPPAMAALDVALWDLLAKQANMPLYKMLGLPRDCVPTSVTIGINPPEVIKERVPEILKQTGAKYLKVKLGSPDGIEADRVNFEAAAKAARPFGVGLRVDANGGWTVGGAKSMLTWLSAQNVDYVEQPLPEGSEDDLRALYHNRPLPIFIDESCRFSEDVARYADRVDGVNLKLMKCGGITEALRIVATARAHHLRTMIGCMSESSVAIAAGAAMGALFDYIDLDSHLNLNPDPAMGAEIQSGVVSPRDVPGHGAELPHA
jgi:L-alanine-DL-glutamate epimerase-like enolase superfamily enzyme